jgi:hypothetical protein
MDTDRLSEAEQLMRRAMETAEAFVGPHHLAVATVLNNQASLLGNTDRLSEAEPLMRRAVAIWEVSLGTDHPNTQTAQRNLKILLKRGRGEPEA